MIEIREVQGYAGLGALDFRERHGQSGLPGQPRAKLPQKADKPRKRTPRQISDVAYVMGIPTEEITPRVHEAITLIVDEMDSLRWESEVGRNYVSNLIEELDHHPYLPVASRHCFYRECENTANHVKRTGEPSSLIYYRLTGLDDIWRNGGQAACDGVLSHAAQIILDGVEAVDTVAEISQGVFCVLLNMFDEDQTIEKAEQICADLENNPANWGAHSFPLIVGWGAYTLSAEDSAEKAIKAAENNLREKLG